MLPKLLSIDPGTNVTGWCISELDYTTPVIKPITTGFITPTKCAKTKAFRELTEKYSVQSIALDCLNEQLTEVMDEWYPQAVVSEDCFINLKMPNAIKALALSIYTIEEVCRFKYGLPVIKYPPMMIKKAFTGKGNATKDDMLYYLTRVDQLDLSNINLPLLLEHEVDAIAVGYTAFKQGVLRC